MFRYGRCLVVQCGSPDRARTKPIPPTTLRELADEYERAFAAGVETGSGHNAERINARVTGVETGRAA